MHAKLAINTLSLAPAPFGEQVDTIARIGGHSITPDVNQMDDKSAACAARLLCDAGLRAAALTHRSFSPTIGDDTPGARDILRRSIAFAHEIGAPVIVMTTGGRGGLSWQDAADCFAETLTPCVALARDAGVQLSIEPTSHLYTDASIVHRLSDTTTLARMAGIGVTIDLFACWFDADIDTAILAAAPITALVQLSDYVSGDRALPCRAVPGDGAVPLARLIPAIVDAGFTGQFDLEIIGPRLHAEGVANGLTRAADTIASLIPAPN